MHGGGAVRERDVLFGQLVSLIVCAAAPPPIPPPLLLAMSDGSLQPFAAIGIIYAGQSCLRMESGVGQRASLVQVYFLYMRPRVLASAS